MNKQTYTSPITSPSDSNINLADDYGSISITFDNTMVDSITLPSTASGQILTTGNTGPLWTSVPTTSGQYNYNYNWTTTTGVDTITLGDYANINPNPDLYVNGDANFEGDVKIKGKSLVDSLEKIEEKLAILRPNEQLEEKWDQLRELRKQYMELEKEIIEKEKMWDILKK